MEEQLAFSGMPEKGAGTGKQPPKKDTAAAAAAAPVAVKPHMQGQQLAMFMSANEIVSKYQVLDGDRLIPHPSAWENYLDGAGDETVERSFDDMGGIRTFGTVDRSGPTNAFGGFHDQRYRRNHRANIRRGLRETDNEVWERKAEEAESNYNPSLQKSIAAKGVKKPVHLMFETGSQNKPSVAGGHHRIAASLDVDGDKLMPVLHHEDWNDVKRIKNSRQPSPYKYY